MMAELDRFEARFVTAYRRYLAEAPVEVDAVAIARQVAAAAPRRHALAGFRPFGLSPALAWTVLLAALLAALVGGLLVAASRPPQELPAVVPNLGPVPTCPPGSTPDEPGPVDQARPSYVARIVFDRSAGRLVAVIPDHDGLGLETWTFDVCANTWTQMHPARELPEEDLVQLVYDVDSDATIGIVSGVYDKVWAYDLEANTWTEKGVAPSGARLGAYDPVSGLVVAASDYDIVGLWTYDVETNTWTQIRQVNGDPCGYVQFGYDASVDRLVSYRESGWGQEEAMCLIDRTGTWSGTHAVTPPGLNDEWYATVPSIVYDEATERTVFSDGRRWVAYDATADHWETLVEADPWGVPLLIVYDPLHRRLVGVGSGEELSGTHAVTKPVVAFDPVTREWTVLLKPAVVLEPGSGQATPP
jgi:hypothetical protein